MNERIRELAQQAKIPEYNLNYGTELCIAPHLEKFAELIVRECIDINKNQLVVIPKDQKDWDGQNYGFTAAVYGFEDLVKEHFGVES